MASYQSIMSLPLYRSFKRNASMHHANGIKQSAIFVSDLHGHISRYEKLFMTIREEEPDFVFFGGDLLPHGLRNMDGIEDFAMDLIFPRLRKLRGEMDHHYPDIFIILGNDDIRSEEIKFIRASEEGLFHYLNKGVSEAGNIKVFGYPFVPPTPFRLKDWEKYDIDTNVRAGSIHPSKGFRSIPPDYDPMLATIESDLEKLAKGHDLGSAIFLIHTPPYNTMLDRAGLDGERIGNTPVDVFIGSEAVRNFIERRQPMLTLHGHVHESTRLTGRWMEKMNRTIGCNAAHDGPELCMIKFRDLLNPADAERTLK